MLRIAKRLYYAERTYARVLELAHEEGISASRLAGFRHWLPAGAVNQKRDDAITMLHGMHACLAADPGRCRTNFVFEDSLWWHELRIHAAERGTSEDDARVLEALSRDPALRERCVAAALGWQLAGEEAQREGTSIDAGHLVDRASSLCTRLDLPDAAALDRWLAANRIARAALERLLETSAVAGRASALRGDILITTLLQFLRWTGDYTRLLEQDELLKPPPA